MLANNVSLKELIDTYALIDNKVIDRGGAQTITPSTTNRVLPKGNYKGDITIKGDANLIAKNIKEGTSIFGVNGSLSELPPGWDNMKNGEVFGGNINKNDAIAWKKYGNWETQLDTIDTSDLPNSNITCASFSGDGKYLALGMDTSPYLYIYKIDKDVLTKLPNPTVKPGSCRFIKFSKDGTFLAVCGNDQYNSQFYINDNDNFTTISKPEFNKGFQCDYDLSDDGTILAVFYIESGTGRGCNTIFVRDKSTNIWKTVYSRNTNLSQSLYNRKPKIHPSGKFICYIGNSDTNIDCFIRNLDGSYSAISIDAPFICSDLDWNKEGNTAIAISTSHNSLRVYSCDIEIGKYFKFEKEFSVKSDSNRIKISSDSLHCIVGDSTSRGNLELFKVNGYTLTSLNKPISAGYYIKCMEFSGDKNYMLIYCDYKTPYIYRTTEKEIVVPIDKLYEGTLMNREIGIALNNGTVGQNIRVNTFTKLKL